MKVTLSKERFIADFKKLRGGNFSEEGLSGIFDYLSEIEDCCETEYEFDPIAICCEFYEAEAKEIAQMYDLSLSGDKHDDSDYVYNFLDAKGVLVAPISNGSFVFTQF
jgi:hypothetical protein